MRLCQDCHREYEGGSSGIYCPECEDNHKPEIGRARKAAKAEKQRRERVCKKKSSKHWYYALSRKKRMAYLQSLPYRKYLKTKWWKKRRQMKICRVGGRCEECGKKLGRRLQVHHKHYKTIGGEKMNALKAVCGQCHLDEHQPIRDRRKLDREYEAMFSDKVRKL